MLLGIRLRLVLDSGDLKLCVLGEKPEKSMFGAENKLLRKKERWARKEVR